MALYDRLRGEKPRALGNLEYAQDLDLFRRVRDRWVALSAARQGAVVPRSE